MRSSAQWVQRDFTTLTLKRLSPVRHYGVKSVDSTGAGDSFNAGLACALSRGYSIEQALDYASAAAALTVEVVGAQSEALSHLAVVEFMTKKQRLIALHLIKQFSIDI